jgi:hypothetical protein
MLPSLLHMGFDNHYNCVDEHDYNQRMQILLPFETIRMIRCLGVLAMGALILVQHFLGITHLMEKPFTQGILL